MCARWSPGADAVDFEAEILPLLKAKCVTCHGGEKLHAELNLSSGSDLLRGGESGAAVVARRPEESLLLQRIRGGEMPPKGNAPLNTSEIERIEAWILQGAKHKLDSNVSLPSIAAKRIVPLMLLRCAPCHGGRRREADLDLRTKASILRGGKSGPAAVPGKPDESLLVKRIAAEEMPPRRQLVSVSVKPMEANELELLKGWIAAGMPESESLAEPAQSSSVVAEQDRQFWSFRTLSAPVRDSVVAKPPQSQGDRIPQFNPIDEYLYAKLRENGLTFSPSADRATLVRRVYFDVLGIPPEPEVVSEFVADSQPDAYERLVERLLASPRYGERWGRYWLDAAGYADSEGAQNEDRVRPEMWRYRDYVIRSFNADKPYDRFLHEQIAGDELADYERAETITEEIYDNLSATGFLRTAPDRTFAAITNFVPDRLEVIADEIQILGSSVLGLTLHCARCHSHKFDPISQEEYYRFAALLKDALDEHDWLGPEKRMLTAVTTDERRAWLEHDQEFASLLNPLKEQLKAASDDSAKKDLEARIKALEARRKPEPKIRALWSRGDPSPTFVLKRGNYLTPGQQVLPGVPAVLADHQRPFSIEPPWPGAKTTGRRLALARWLTRDDHPLTARVMANRLWRHHFGRGIVASMGNFGKTGSPPSHPQLLDWLAAELVRHEWSLKTLHRWMLYSIAYRQSSRVTAELLAADRDNVLLSRMPLKRLEAETVRDSLLFVSGRLNLSAYGPADQIDERADGLISSKDFGTGGRRSIFVLHRRTKLPTILESFDSPQMGPNCVERGESIVAPQALHLLNNAAVHMLAQHFASRVMGEASEPSPRAWIIRAHELAFGQPPDREQLQVAQASFEQIAQRWREELNDESARQPSIQALHNYCHAILNSAAMLYVD